MDSSRQDEQNVGSRFSNFISVRFSNPKFEKKHVFLVGLCWRVFVNTSSILALHPNQEHQYIRIVKTKRMVKTVFRISFFFFFLKFKIQLLFYVNPRVTVMKVLLFVFAGAMVDLSTPLVVMEVVVHDRNLFTRAFRAIPSVLLWFF